MARSAARHDALQAHDAGLPEDRGAVLVGVVPQDEAEPTPAQQLRQPLLAVSQRHAAEVLAVGSRRSKAYNMVSLTVPRRCRASKTNGILGWRRSVSRARPPPRPGARSRL